MVLYKMETACWKKQNNVYQDPTGLSSPLATNANNKKSEQTMLLWGNNTTGRNQRLPPPRVHTIKWHLVERKERVLDNKVLFEILLSAYSLYENAGVIAY